MFKKKFARVLAITLALGIVVGVGPAMGDEPKSGHERDPFAEMKDELLGPYRAAGGRSREADGDSEHHILETRKTDRYIVMYNEGRRESFERKTSASIEESIDILAAGIDMRTGAFGLNGKGERAPVTIPHASRATENMRLIILKEPRLPSDFAAEIKARGADSDIIYVQPDFELQLESFGVSEEKRGDDSENTSSGGSNTPDAAAREVVVAVIDSGMDTGHEAFKGCLHSAAPDTPTGSLSFAHGTFLAGIIADVAKQTGANIKILPIRVFVNGAYTSDIISAVCYAASMGAELINCSFGSTAYNQALFDVIADCSALIIAAVGNNRRDYDTFPSFPAGYSTDLPNVISVASVNSDGGFSFFSNRGSNSILISATGRDVYSTFPGNKYGTMTGTSISAANVSGVAASVLSQESMEAWELRDRLVNTADKLSNLQNKVIDGRRINLSNALSGQPGATLVLDPAEDFDVHGYERTREESWQLFSSVRTVQITAAGNHTLILKSDGSVWTCGDNVNYSISPGCTVPEYYTDPEQVIGLTDIIKITAGEYHNMAIKSDGTLWAWGDNSYGQLGDGTCAVRYTPVQVIGIMDATDISAGYDHSLVALSGGEVYGMGDNSMQQVTDGNFNFTSTPEQIPLPSGADHVDAKEYKSLAVGNSGDVWVWGDEYSYNGSFVSIGELEGCKAQAGIMIKPSRTVWAWEVQPGKYSINYSESEVEGLSGIVEVTGEFFNSLALKDDGSAWYTDWSSSTQIGELENIVGITNGHNHYLALDSGGGLWAWGDNSYGQLGDGTTNYSATPILVQEGSASGAARLSFDSTGYSIVVPTSGMATVSMTATVYDEFDQAVPNAAISYSLVTPYTGVSISSSTGLATADTTAQPGITTVKAEYQGLSVTTQLELASFDPSVLQLPVTQNSQYRITLCAFDVSSFTGMAITVVYDPVKLQLMNAAEQTYGEYATTGAIPGTGITIVSVSPGTLVMAFEKSIPPGKTWSGVITVLKFKALASGIAAISVE